MEDMEDYTFVAPTSKTSIYYPLADGRQIRLLVLFPSGKRDMPIRCNIQAVSLENEVSYEALSWEWGFAFNTEEVKLNGPACSIPSNLAQALRQYRLPDETRCLWADAICINQADLDERSHQITLMMEIYDGAKLVLVWLDPTATEVDSEVSALLGRLCDGCELRHLFRQSMAGDPASWISIEIAEEGLQPVRESWQFWNQLSRFFHLGWWRRLWVLQEVVVAREVQFRWGNVTIGLQTLLEAHDSLLEHVQHSSEQVVPGGYAASIYLDLAWRHLHAIRNVRHVHAQLQDGDWTSTKRKLYGIMFELLASTRHRSATDERDKIFGLLGILPMEVTSRIQPSYSKSIATTFFEVAYHILELTKSFMLFSCAVKDVNNTRYINWGQNYPPSWVPCWADSWVHDEDFRFRINQQDLFSASAGMEWQLSVSADKDLQVKGIRVDRIKTVTKLNSMTTLTSAWSEEVRKNYLPKEKRSPGVWVVPKSNDFEDVESSHPRAQNDNTSENQTSQELRYPDGSSAVEAIYRTALNDCIPIDKEGTLIRAQREDWMAFRGWVQQPSLIPQSELKGEVYSEILSKSEPLSLPFVLGTEVLRTVRTCIADRVLFLTALGYIGLVREVYSQPADEVWILAGGSHPVVLRPLEGFDDAYEAVAEVYMHGVMDGEVVRGECPMLPADDNAEPIRAMIKEGKRRWPVPEWTDIQIL